MRLITEDLKILHNGDQVGRIGGNFIELEHEPIRKILLDEVRQSIPGYVEELQRVIDRDREIREEKQRQDNNLGKLIDSLENETGRLYAENRILKNKLYEIS